MSTFALTMSFICFLISSSTCHGLTYTALTKPLPLYPGEVTNTWHHLSIPPGPIAISEFSADIVEKKTDDNGKDSLIPVPLSEAYLHHHVVYSSHKYYDEQKHWWSPMKMDNDNVNRGVGFGAGTESRGTRQVFPFPYRFTTVAGEDELVANVHVINTRTMSSDQAHHCLECPCTSEDYDTTTAMSPDSSRHWHWPWSHSGRGNNKEFGYATTNETDTAAGKAPNVLSPQVIERRTHWDKCNAQLTNESNSACFPNSYHGGLLCCEHGEFCLDEYYTSDKNSLDQGQQQSVFYLRYTLKYEPLTNENHTTITPLYLAACCDATGNLTSTGNIEYDIPKQVCDQSKGGENKDNCTTHTLTTVQEIHGASDAAFGTSDSYEKEDDRWVDLVYMVGHLHRGGIEMSAYFENGTLLCRSLPAYGTGQVGEIGNEPGYINAMSTCTFDPPIRVKTTDKIRLVGKYNASQAHTGVMSLFYLAIADVPGSTDDHEGTGFGKERTSEGFFGRYQGVAVVMAFVIVAFATLHIYRYKNRRRGYEQIGGATSVDV